MSLPQAVSLQFNKGRGFPRRGRRSDYGGLQRKRAGGDSGRFLGNQSAEFRFKAFDLCELSLYTFKESGLSLNALFNQEPCRFCATAEDTGLDQLLPPFLGVRT